MGLHCFQYLKMIRGFCAIRFRWINTLVSMVLLEYPNPMSAVQEFSPSTKVLVIGASGGIGHACAIEAGNRFGMKNVTMLSRAADGLDILDEVSVCDTLASLGGLYDFILITTGGLEVGGYAPEKSLRSISSDAFQVQFALNAIGPALLLKYVARLLPKDRPATIATLSARVGSIGDNRLGGWISYRAAKAALNQVIRTTAIELTRTHPHSTCVALHPGTVRTPLSQSYVGTHPSVAPQDAAHNIFAVIEGLSPADTGQFFDWKGETIPW